jgi:soluble lytic murein transglycosylase
MIDWSLLLWRRSWTINVGRLILPICFVLFCVDASAKPSWPGISTLDSEPGYLRAWPASMSTEHAEARARAWLAEAETGVSQSMARFTLALSLYRQRKYDQAVPHFVAAETGLVNKDFAVFFAGESLFQTQKYEVALKAVNRLIRHYPHSVWIHRAQVRRADCYFALGQYARAIKGYQAIVNTYPDYPQPISIRMCLAQAYERMGKLRSAANWYYDALLKFPGDPIINQVKYALSDLKARGVLPKPQKPADLLRIGADLRRRKFFGPSLKILQRVVSHRDVRKPTSWRAKFQIARVFYQTESYQTARERFRLLSATAPSVRQRRRAHRWESRSLERLGHIDVAADVYRRGTLKSPALSIEALTKLAWIYFNGAAYSKASSRFDELAERNPSQARRSWFWRAWFAYRDGDYETAMSGFREVGQIHAWTADKTRYWLARSLAHLGRSKDALYVYRSIIKKKPLSYYAYQAKARIGEIEATNGGEARRARPFSVKPHDGYVGFQNQCIGWDTQYRCRNTVLPFFGVQLDDQFNSIPKMASLRSLTREYGNALPALRAALELAVVGEYQWAAKRLRWVSDELSRFRGASRSTKRRWQFEPRGYVDFRNGTKRGQWGTLKRPRFPRSSRRRIAFLGSRRARTFRSRLRGAFIALGDAFYVRRLTVRSERPKKVPELGKPALWKTRYARPFPHLVMNAAKDYGLDPLLLWAFMTVESSYNPWSISRAGARGLMQVMPHTGALVASGIGWGDFGTALLHEPAVSIEMSAWYIRELLTKFRGQLPLAIAGYNAGPHRVAMWLKSKGTLDMDEFIEEIPYDEAREYTKKVLRHLALYQRIYTDVDVAWQGQWISPKPRGNINY